MKQVLLSVLFSFVITVVLSWMTASATEIPDFVARGEAGQKGNQFLTRLIPFGFHGSALVVKEGQIILHNAYGSARIDHEVPNTTGTVFSTGSVTKQFTAAGIMLLNQRDKLSVTDSLGKFFKNVPTDKQGITIHHLMTHSSGIRPEFGPDEETIDRAEYLKRVFAAPLDGPIGSGYEYSNAGFSILAAIIEVVSGMEYEAFMRANFFEPLGMTKTGLKLLEVAPDDVAHSHNAGLLYPSPADRPDEYYHLKGNGGMLSTPADMYRWMAMLSSDQILNKKSRQAIFTPHIKEYEGQESFYGYGWVVQRSSKDRLIHWHNGGAMPHGWSCAVYHYVEDDALFIIFSNATIDGDMPVDAIVARLVELTLYGKESMPPEIAEVDPGTLGRHTGEYLLEGGGSLKVDFSGNRLVIKPSGQSAMAAIFPSPYASMLPKYNGKTETLINALAADDFETALEFFDQEMASPEDWREMAQEWWGSFDSLGQFQSVEILGTSGGGGARTHALLHFQRGSIMSRFGWMGGKCGGMMAPTEPPARELIPQSETKFAGYLLMNGAIITAQFGEDGSLLLDLDGQKLKGDRRN